ncbi:MAG: ATP-dependent protease ATPase subunit HslU [Bacillota bacterium]|nr:ATP-dependent protease ATPase subunit HslU [Bacillota bacterium]
MRDLTPREIVRELDRHIVGQHKAKRAVAIALRNRYRRQQLPEEMREEVLPKNILMIGPTGVGKTEIARRLARLVGAPMIKVEATKFTEVGYVGRDVEGMVRDLVETSIRMVKSQAMEKVMEQAAAAAERRLLDAVVPMPKRETSRNPLEAIFSGFVPREDPEDDAGFQEQVRRARLDRADARQRLVAGELEQEIVEIEVDDTSTPTMGIFSPGGVEEIGLNIQDMLGGLMPKRRKKRRVPVHEARRILTQEEAQQLIDQDEAVRAGVEQAEQSGIIFIDELDKIASRERGMGPDVSREGVQRDILPIVEGSTVITKYGPVKTDHMLFIAAGAFHISKPSDLIPELQGRFPLRVELDPLTESDFRRILTEPRNSLTQQYEALMGADGVILEFTEDGIAELASVAVQVNESTENIGARRLYTVMERLLEEVSYESPEAGASRLIVDREYVRRRLANIIEDRDLTRYIL